MKVTIFHAVNPTFTGAVDQERKEVFSYDYNGQGEEDACEHAFHVTNAPQEILDGNDLAIAKEYRVKKLRSLSVGDAVQIGDNTYICQSSGWLKI